MLVESFKILILHRPCVKVNSLRLNGMLPWIVHTAAPTNIHQLSSGQIFLHFISMNKILPAQEIG